MPLSLVFNSFQERKHKNFHVESEPFFGNLLNQTLIGLTKPGRNFGLGASRNSIKPLSLQLNSRKIRPEFRSAFFWTVFKSGNTKFFMINPTHFCNIFLKSFFKLISLSLHFGQPASKKRPKNL